MIYIETDEDGLCKEMISAHHDRKPIKVSGKKFAIQQITRNCLKAGGVSVEVKGEPVSVPVWSGDGHPPAGAVCEYSIGEPSWFLCEIRYVLDCDQDPESDGWRAVIWCPHLGKEQFARHNFKFRPIRTPQQIAEDERKSEISFMASCIAHSGCRNAPTGNDIAAAAHLHYLGYRKL